MAKVLVVDDEERDRLVTHMILEDAGHEVVSVTSAVAAGGAWLDDSYDVVVTDLEIPDLQGHELLKRLERHAHARVIALRGPGADRLRFASRLTPTTTLRKPVDHDRLLEAVQRLSAG